MGVSDSNVLNPYNPGVAKNSVTFGDATVPATTTASPISQLKGIAAKGSTGAGIPQHVTNVTATVANAATGSTSTVTVQFSRSSNDTSYSGVNVYVVGYQGNKSQVQIAGGSESPVTFVLNNTGEAVNIIVQARGNAGVAPLSTAPSTGIKLPKSTTGGYGTTTVTAYSASNPPPSSSAVTAPFMAYANSGNNTPALTANHINLGVMELPFSLTFSNMAWVVATQDLVNLYDLGIYDTSGNLLCHVGARHLQANAGGQAQTASTGSTTLSAGTYLFAFTGNSNSGNIFFSTPVTTTLGYFSTATTSSGGVLPSTIAVSTSVTTATPQLQPTIMLY